MQPVQSTPGTNPLSAAAPAFVPAAPEAPPQRSFLHDRAFVNLLYDVMPLAPVPSATNLPPLTVGLKEVTDWLRCCPSPLGQGVVDIQIVNALAAQAVGGPKALTWHFWVQAPAEITDEEKALWIDHFRESYLRVKLRLIDPALEQIDKQRLIDSYQANIDKNCFKLGPRIAFHFTELAPTFGVSSLNGWWVSLIHPYAVGGCELGRQHVHSDYFDHYMWTVRNRQFLAVAPNHAVTMLQALSDGASVTYIDWHNAQNQILQMDPKVFEAAWVESIQSRLTNPCSKWVEFLNLWLLVSTDERLCSMVAQIWMDNRAKLDLGDGILFVTLIKEHPTLTAPLLYWLHGAIVYTWLQPAGAEVVQPWLLAFFADIRQARPLVAFPSEVEPRHLAFAGPTMCGSPGKVVKRFLQASDTLAQREVNPAVFGSILEVLRLSPIHKQSALQTAETFQSEWMKSKIHDLHLLAFPEKYLNAPPKFLSEWIAKHSKAVNPTSREELKLPPQGVPAASQSTRPIVSINLRQPAQVVKSGKAPIILRAATAAVKAAIGLSQPPQRTHAPALPPPSKPPQQPKPKKVVDPNAWTVVSSTRSARSPVPALSQTKASSENEKLLKTADKRSPEQRVVTRIAGNTSVKADATNEAARRVLNAAAAKKNASTLAATPPLESSEPVATPSPALPAQPEPVVAEVEVAVPVNKAEQPANRASKRKKAKAYKPVKQLPPPLTLPPALSEPSQKPESKTADGLEIKSALETAAALGPIELKLVVDQMIRTWVQIKGAVKTAKDLETVELGFLTKLCQLAAYEDIPNRTDYFLRALRIAMRYKEIPRPDIIAAVLTAMKSLGSENFVWSDELSKRVDEFFEFLGKKAPLATTFDNDQWSQVFLDCWTELSPEKIRRLAPPMLEPLKDRLTLLDAFAPRFKFAIFLVATAAALRKNVKTAVPDAIQYSKWAKARLPEDKYVAYCKEVILSMKAGVTKGLKPGNGNQEHVNDISAALAVMERCLPLWALLNHEEAAKITIFLLNEGLIYDRGVLAERIKTLSAAATKQNILLAPLQQTIDFLKLKNKIMETTDDSVWGLLQKMRDTVPWTRQNLVKELYWAHYDCLIRCLQQAGSETDAQGEYCMLPLNNLVLQHWEPMVNQSQNCPKIAFNSSYQTCFHILYLPFFVRAYSVANQGSLADFEASYTSALCTYAPSAGLMPEFVRAEILSSTTRIVKSVGNATLLRPMTLSAFVNALVPVVLHMVRLQCVSVNQLANACRAAPNQANIKELVQVIEVLLQLIIDAKSIWADLGTDEVKIALPALEQYAAELRLLETIKADIKPKPEQKRD